MVQIMWDILTGLLYGLGRLLIPAAIALFVGLLFLLLLSLIDRERVRGLLAQMLARLPLMRRWLWPVLALGLGFMALNITLQALNLRLSAQLNAHTRNSADPDGQPTTQAGPTVTLVEPHTYNRTLTLPRDLYTRLEVAGGWEALTPYLNSNSETPTVQDIQEAFTARGKSLYYTREVTMLQERPLALDSSNVLAQLDFGKNNSVYNAAFSANYTFTNPEDAPITARFQFPLPAGSGTLSHFVMKVDGKEYRAADLSGGSTWEGEVAPHAAVQVNVSYQHQGSRGWSYQLSRRREPIRAFALRVIADHEARFGRYSLYPTQTSGKLFGPKVLDWKLTDVITAQNVSVLFSQGSMNEVLRKLHMMMPFALLLLAILSLLWAARRRLRLNPQALGWAVLGLSLGYTLGGILTAYLPPTAAEILGAVGGLALALRALGRGFVWPLLLSACLPLTFLVPGHSGLLASGLAIVTVLLLGIKTQQDLTP